MGMLSKQVRKVANQRYVADGSIISTQLDAESTLQVVTGICDDLNANFDAWFAETNGRGKWYEAIVTEPKFHRYYYDHSVSNSNMLHVSFSLTPQRVLQLHESKRTTKGRFWFANVLWSENDEGRRLTIQLVLWTNDQNGKFHNKDRYEALVDAVSSELAD